MKVVEKYEPILYTINEIATIFKISRRTVENMIERGELRAFKVGGCWRINQSEIERLCKPEKRRVI